MNNFIISNTAKSNILLSLGSNIGDRLLNINKAVRMLKDSDIVEDIKISSFYETSAVGYTNQPKFLNIALSGNSFYDPYTLLFLLKSTEYLLGRKLRDRWHEREIDIDIIFYDNRIIEIPQLKIPHKEMQFRKFVLIPANDLNPNLMHPILNKTISQLLFDCMDSSEISKY